MALKRHSVIPHISSGNPAVLRRLRCACPSAIKPRPMPDAERLVGGPPGCSPLGGRGPARPVSPYPRSPALSDWPIATSGPLISLNDRHNDRAEPILHSKCTPALSRSFFLSYRTKSGIFERSRVDDLSCSGRPERCRKNVSCRCAQAPRSRLRSLDARSLKGMQELGGGKIPTGMGVHAKASAHSQRQVIQEANKHGYRQGLRSAF
jgi:hypothetical protein